MSIYIPGLLITVVLISIAKKSKKRRNLSVLIASLPLALIAGFRWNVGTDFLTYYNAFSILKNSGNYDFDFLFLLLSKISISLFDSVQGAFIVSSVLIMLLISKCILDYSEIPELSTFVFFMLGYYFSSMNIIRQYIALSFAFFSLRFLWKRKWLWFVSFCIIAVGFHASAVIVLILYPICCIRFSKLQYLLITGVSILISTQFDFLAQIIVTAFPQYAYVIRGNIERLRLEEILYYAFLLIPLLLVGIINFSHIKCNKLSLFSFNCVFFSLLVYVLLNRVPLLNRAALYLEFLLVLYIPIVIETFSKRFRKLYLYLGIAVFSAIFFITIIEINRYGILPYTFRIY